MKTFFGKYENGSFVYSNDTETLRAQLISILNTPAGSRFYAPTYGSHLREYRFSVLNYYTINMIGQEIKEAIHLMDGVTLSKIQYTLNGNKLVFAIELTRLSERIAINLTVADGVAS